ncbi:MAG: hypothetical protein ACLFNU_06090 [Bacteroidales bacterium]
MDNSKPKDNLEQTQTKPKSKAVAFLATLIVILAAVLIVLGWVYYSERKEAAEVQSQLNAEKDSIELNLRDIVYEYEVLETDNEKVKVKLEEEQERAEKLYQELRQVRQVSYNKIKEYQRELGTLRSIMRDMVQEIDSLNTLNQELIAENIKVRQEYNMSQRNVETLEQEREELSSAVEKGSKVRARDINPMTNNRRGRKVSRARFVDKIKTCFILSENNIAKPGLREVYLRILGPDGFILAKSNTDMFEFEGERIIYSAKREVDYQNEDVEMCIFYDNNGELVSGKYEVSLFMDGYMIGYGEFMLK